MDAAPRHRGSVSPEPHRRLKIGIDGSCFGSRRGYGRFLREVLPRVLEQDRTNDYVLFVDRITAETAELPDMTTVLVETRAGQTSAASARGNRSLRDLWAMSRAVSRTRLDLLFFPSVYSYFPVTSPVPVVVALHDTIAERHGEVVFPSLRTRWLWTAKVALARWQAAGVVTVSEWSRRRLSEYFGIPLEDIHVIPEAPAEVFRPTSDPAPRAAWLESRGLSPVDPYFLYVGGFNPHKNLPALVDAFAEVAGRPQNASLRLLLVGDHEGDVFHADVGALRARIGRLGMTDRIAFAGFVPDETLRHLYAGAVAVVLPSLEEGFGLPAIEGAACGAPAIATRESPLPELLEGGGIFVDPTRPAELRDAMAVLLSDPSQRDRLARNAIARANRLTWSAAAESARTVLERVARSRS